MSKLGTELSKLHKNETIKDKSNYLRGTLAEGLADLTTGTISADDSQLSKFHGVYVQDDRDVRAERRKKMLEPAYSYLIRVRVPGGVCTPDQWLKLDELADVRANHTLRITTRQAFQFHGVIKSNLKQVIKEINDVLLDTIAACGDVNRNVMCNPNPHASVHHAEVLKLSQDISDHLTPSTTAYHEIWLNGDCVEGGAKSVEDHEPIYGKHYLPRKFKIVVAVPPSNDVDIYAHDLGYIAIVEDDKIVGYNVTVGGGMGMTHGNESTYPQIAKLLGFCTPEQAVEIAEKIVLVQRDNGNRENRANARLKYTIDHHGLDWFRDEVEKLLGYKLKEARAFKFETRGDRFGWLEGTDGKWHFTLYVESGRVKCKLKTGLRKIAEIHKGDFRLTCNQNLIIGAVAAVDKPAIEALISEYSLACHEKLSGLRLNTISCVAFPTCGLALAESERYLPDLVGELETVLDSCSLSSDEIVIRMTGCPNGCGRPFLAEIGFVGKGPRTYNVYLGGSFEGERLNKLYKLDVKDVDIVPLLKPIIEDYAKTRNKDEHFGDFVIRKEYLAATTDGQNFH